MPSWTEPREQQEAKLTAIHTIGLGGKTFACLNAAQAHVVRYCRAVGETRLRVYRGYDDHRCREPVLKGERLWPLVERGRVNEHLFDDVPEFTKHMLKHRWARAMSGEVN